jgi:hypothetical protein
VTVLWTRRRRRGASAGAAAREPASADAARLEADLERYDL